MPSDDMMFSSRTTPELERLYSGMNATADELGVPLTVRPQKTRQFADRNALIRACRTLHTSILKFRAGLDSSDETQVEQPRGSPGLRRLRSHPQAEAIRQQTLTDNTEARRRAVSKMGSEQMLFGDDTKPAEGAAPAPASETAPAAPAKREKSVTKKAKKAKAPKKAKKAKKASGGGTKTSALREAKIGLDKKIKVVTKENPRRADTTQHERYAALMKADGKTVEEFLKKGGDRTALNLAVEQEHVKIV